VNIQPDPRGPRAARRTKARRWIDPVVWTRRDMRLALAERDVATIYRILQRFGVSQRRIATLTEQSQGEVSEIVAGKRQVVSYDVLIRIADGLEVARGWMGLGLDPPEGIDHEEV
jgi:predicted XRE-type DNA-binding protein